MTATFTDCSAEYLARKAKQFGFQLFEGKNHTKVKTAEGTLVTMIPRHSHLKRPTAKAIGKSKYIPRPVWINPILRLG